MRLTGKTTSGQSITIIPTKVEVLTNHADKPTRVIGYRVYRSGAVARNQNGYQIQTDSIEWHDATDSETAAELAQVATDLINYGNGHQNWIGPGYRTQ